MTDAGVMILGNTYMIPKFSPLFSQGSLCSDCEGKVKDDRTLHP